MWNLFTGGLSWSLTQVWVYIVIIYWLLFCHSELGMVLLIYHFSLSQLEIRSVEEADLGLLIKAIRCEATGIQLICVVNEYYCKPGQNHWKWAKCLRGELEPFIFKNLKAVIIFSSEIIVWVYLPSTLAMHGIINSILYSSVGNVNNLVKYLLFIILSLSLHLYLSDALFSNRKKRRCHHQL